MSATQTDENDEEEMRDYRVLNRPLNGVQPGETIELRESVADAFSDNLIDPDADPEDEAVHSQVVGNQAGTVTLSDLLNREEIDEIEAGDYVVVGPTPIDVVDEDGDSELVEPGEPIDAIQSVAVAFADNLRMPDDSADDSADDEAEVTETDPDPDLDPSSTDPENGTFNEPAELLNGTVPEVEERLETLDLDEAQLNKIRDAEVNDQDRNGVHEAIDEELDQLGGE